MLKEMCEILGCYVEMQYIFMVFVRGMKKKMYKCYENVFNYQLLVDIFLDKFEYILFVISVGIRKR